MFHNKTENCFCCSIETATKILAILGIFESIIIFFTSINTVILLSTVQGIETTFNFLNNLFQIISDMETSSQKEASFVGAVVNCSYANIFLSVPNLIAFSCLTFAVFSSKNEKFVNPVLVMIPVNIVKTLIISIVMTSFLGAFAIIVGFIWNAVIFAVWFLFHIYRGELKDDSWYGDEWESPCSCKICESIFHKIELSICPQECSCKLINVMFNFYWALKLLGCFTAIHLEKFKSTYVKIWDMLK